MKSIWLALPLAMAASFSAVAAGANAPMKGCHALPWEAEPNHWDVGQNFPANVNREALIHELYPGELPETKYYPYGAYPREDFVGIGIKPWNHEGGTHLVILETDKRDINTHGGTDSLARFLRIALIQILPDSTYKVIAKTQEPVQLDEYYRFNKFDLAPYQYTNVNYALGIRECNINCGTGACNNDETLMLFKIAEGNIQSLLSTPIAWETDVIRGEGKSKSEEARISIDSKKITNGYFHLIKRLNKKTATYYWDGQKYTTSDKDPLGASE